MSDIKIILLDIETAPSLGWVWQKWEANVLDFKKDWYLLSYAWKELGKQKLYIKGLIDYPNYAADREDDKALTEDLWKVVDDADIIIAHNGDAFDMPKINTRFIFHKLAPPSPYETIDTLKIARRIFHFDSNKLDDLGGYLHVGRKLPHTGFHLWQGCMTGDPKSWSLMKRYNGQDVILLEQVYFKLRPWADNHPSIILTGKKGNTACPKCGSVEYQKRGMTYTATTAKPRFQCKKCNGWFTGNVEKKAVEKVAEKEKTEVQNDRT